jgi:hypothetical protein
MAQISKKKKEKRGHESAEPEKQENQRLDPSFKYFLPNQSYPFSDPQSPITPPL